MERLDDEWVAELRRIKEDHILFTPLQMRLMDVEKKYQQLLKSLEPQQQEVMREYVQINQQLEIWLTNQAYLCGIQVGERRAKGREAETV